MERTYRLFDLCSLSRATPAQIRRWIGEGVVPNACGRGRGAYYTDAHLDRIRAVMAAYEANVTIVDIRDRLNYARDGDADR